mmetsp:Transcript_28256/g.45768  ORF Transcript_28256/g.45768 Transcript_28256/m.45768 type:complete len:904 (+) Transcript_28256:140-2851(+)
MARFSLLLSPVFFFRLACILITLPILLWDILLLVVVRFLQMAHGRNARAAYIFASHFLSGFAVVRRRCRQEELEDNMRNAQSYNEWLTAAVEADRLDGRDDWRRQEHCAIYDSEQIRQTLKHLQSLRESKDVEEILSTSEYSLCTRNLANSGHPDLYREARSGTKHLVDEFTAEVVNCINFIRDYRNAPSSDQSQQSSPTPSTTTTTTVKERITALTRMQRTIGHTALCLSGGGSLALYHFGVVKCLLDLGLLPKVVSGSSGGAIVAAWIGCQSPENLRSDITPELIAKTGVPMSDPFHVEIVQLVTTGAMRSSETLMRFFKALYGDLTFEEAYHKSRRVIAISITNKRSGSEPPVLSYLTSPQVLVRSAVLASCSLPLLALPTTLLAKDRSGNIIPYEASGVQWIDGSFTNDVPVARLSELFNVTQCIAVQVNPHIAMFMPRCQRRSGFIGTLLSRAADSLMLSIKYRYFSMKSTGLLGALDLYDALISQSYTADVTIVPDISIFDLPRAVTEPSIDDMKLRLRLGMLATYPHVAMIRNRTAIERAIDEALQVQRKCTFIDAANQVRQKMSRAIGLANNNNNNTNTSQHNRSAFSRLSEVVEQQMKASGIMTRRAGATQTNNSNEKKKKKPSPSAAKKVRRASTQSPSLSLEKRPPVSASASPDVSRPTSPVRIVSRSPSIKVEMVVSPEHSPSSTPTTAAAALVTSPASPKASPPVLTKDNDADRRLSEIPTDQKDLLIASPLNSEFPSAPCPPSPSLECAIPAVQSPSSPTRSSDGNSSPTLSRNPFNSQGGAISSPKSSSSFTRNPFSSQGGPISSPPRDSLRLVPLSSSGRVLIPIVAKSVKSVGSNNFGTDQSDNSSSSPERGVHCESAKWAPPKKVPALNKGDSLKAKDHNRSAAA